MKRQCTILSLILRDQCSDSSSKSIERDILTMISRSEQEGESFFSLTHPAMHDDLMVSVQNGVWTRSRLWKEHRRGGPVYLREFLRHLFDFDNGGAVLRGEEAARSLRFVRQYLLFFSKMRALPSDDKISKSLNEFRETELRLREGRKSILLALSDPLLKEVVKTLITPYLKKVESEVHDILPRHGPGATADGSRYGRKYRSLRHGYTHRVSRIYPYDEFAFANQRHWYDSLDPEGQFISPADELPMKIAAVPKTQKSPRLIAEEPVVNQFFQQGIHAVMIQKITRDPLGVLCDWTDQLRNRELARTATGRGLSTLDLSEASDRVHVSVVNLLFQDVPELRSSILSCRSTRCVTARGVLRLEKFAPMGSALCFPVESLFFTAIAVWNEARRDSKVRSLVLTRNRKALVGSLRGRVSIYGDDIIVPVGSAPSMVDLLESVGLKVNRRKSFWSGYFRESCGSEWFDGFDVSIVKAREPIPYHRSDHRSVQSWATVQNSLFLMGYERSSEYLVEILSQLGVPCHPPSEDVVHVARSNTLCLTNSHFQEFIYDTELHRPRIAVLKPQYEARSIEPDEWDRLHDWFLSASRRSPHVLAENDSSFSYDRPPELVRLRPRTVPL